MTQLYLSIGTKIKVKPTAEALAGEMAYIQDVAPGTSHPYCVHKSRQTTNVTNSHWLRMSDVVPTAPRLTRERQKTVAKVASRVRRGMEIGRKVLVDPVVPFGPRTGYVLAFDYDSVLLTSDPKLVHPGNIWIRRQYVRMA